MLNDLLDRPVRGPAPAVSRHQPGPGRGRRTGRLLRLHLAPALGLLALLALTAVLQLSHLQDPRRTPAEAAVAARVQELLVGGRWPGAEVGVLSWLPVAGWVALTGAAGRHDSVVVAGREAMLVPVLVTVLLVWLLARALRLTGPGAPVASLLVVLAPPAVPLHQTLEPSLLAAPLVLAGVLLALVERGRFPAALVGAGCLGAAVLVEPLTAVAVPVWVGLLWWRGGPDRRRVVGSAAAVLALLLLTAALADRAGTALLVLPDRGGALDPAAAALPALLLPAAALVGGAVAEWLWRAAGSRGGPRRRRLAQVLLLAVVVAVLGGLTGPGVLAAWRMPTVPGDGAVGWLGQWQRSGRGAQDDAQRQAQAWVEKQVDRDQRLLGDGALGPDLAAAGFPARNLLRTEDLAAPSSAPATPGWQQVDYLLLTESLRAETVGSPALEEARRQSSPVAVFGSGADRVEILRVHPEGVLGAERQARADQRARVVVGTELAQNPAVELDGGTLALVQAGRVDARVLIGLSRVGALGPVTVADLPPVPGELEEQVPRRQALLTALDGSGLTGDRAAIEAVAVRLAEQDPAYAPRSVQVVPDGLLVTWGVDAPPGLLAVGSGS